MRSSGLFVLSNREAIASEFAARLKSGRMVDGVGDRVNSIFACGATDFELARI
jgi:hypothetical protein